ncbi:hypothetical protein Glove_276g34 [Diversispora epigaea]|uniref:Protein kinase domain-containing protein n=1 Tax=Diversispora epigaea TaxID=1348612 RepID=A0A397I442_9GLOM|nr:hypothetical protein Glove_276g34 [Diversispora epigaea]
MSSDEICQECNQEYSGYKWYKPCNSKHFQNDFNNWTSGNEKIDKFIQDAQLNANHYLYVIEWIPYDRFKDVKQIGKGGFGTIHYARWIDGYIEKWDIKNQQWKRDRKYSEEVALKKFDNFVNFNDVLNEMGIHFKSYTDSDGGSSIRFYGITQDPKTHSYMMVLEYASDGNLREYLKINFNNINWKQKLYNLRELSDRLMNIHKLDIVHQDFHPGNILSSDFNSNLKITDFGLSKLIGANSNNPKKKNIFGVLPYIAPEVLSGDEEYTKAADVYSFGIIAYEMITGIPPYPEIPHDKDLAIKICNGLRPKIPFHTPKLITRVIMRYPKTHSYMMVLEYASDGNLREYLKINFNNINWKQKLYNLRELSDRLMNIHKLDIVHQDFHPGNILSSDFNSNLKITDFGLSKLIGANSNNPKKKNIFGVLPYIAPEVLSGDEEYTKAADVYSFGIIAYEMITGIPPYPEIPHDKDLAIKICNGLRPKIPFHTPKLITRVIMRCWDARVTHRPTFEELSKELEKYYYDYKGYLDEEENQDSEIGIRIKKAEEFSANQESTNTINTTTTTSLNYQTHPQAIYTSRLLNYSKLPKPKNEENFERELEELTKSFLHINTNNDIDEF